MYERKKPITDWQTVPVVIDLKYAARIIGVSEKALIQRCQKKQFPAYKEGKLWRVKKESLLEHIDKSNIMRAE